ncbi:MAG: glycosyltransferase family 92 protein [Candidatus Protochlamydia sp.]|nr:glycosyltransferase family 92 protein [Candidatus Protochlamydia sp.]
MNKLSKRLTIYCIICFFYFNSCEGKNFKYTLSIAAIFQDEATYMKEWIEYHQLVGVEYFFLYNNNSCDDYLSVLEPYIKKGVVELIQWPSIKQEGDWANFCYTVQTDAYDNALARSMNVTKWLALIDIDEFIVPVNYETVPQLLESKYSNVSGLCVNWQFYGTSGVDNIDKKYPMISQLVMKMQPDDPSNRLCKTIVQPHYAKSWESPHYCLYQDGCYAVDAKFRKCPKAITKTVEIDEIRLNHYWTRDEHYFNSRKIARYLQWGRDSTELIERASLMNAKFDGIMGKFLPKLCRLNITQPLKFKTLNYIEAKCGKRIE